MPVPYLVPTAGMDGVRQLETSDLAMAGPGGVMNAQAQALLNRTEHLSILIAALAGFAGQNNTFTKGQRGAFVPATSSGGSVPVDLNDSNNYVLQLTENTTLALPTHPVAGQAGVFEVNQHASAAKTLGFHAFWVFPSAPVIAGAGGHNLMTYLISSDASFAWCEWR